MRYIIRKREYKDLEAIERVVTLGWNQTYKGLVSDRVLDVIREKESLRVDKRKEDFDSNNNDYLVLEVDGEVIGFCRYGESEEEGYGEIFALYILNGYKGNGYGKELVLTASSMLKEMGFDKMLIGCLVGNPSNEFYKHLGGKFIKTKTSIRLDEEMTDNIYEFNI